MRIGLGTTTALSTALLACVAPAWAQGADAARRYDAPAGPLARSLSVFIEQSRLQILYPAVLVEGRTSRGLQGDYTAEAGLAALLRDTGLAFRRTRPNVYVLYDPNARAGMDDSELTVVDDVVVTGSLIRGVGDGPSPVVSIDRDRMDREGRATVAQLLAALPQNFGGTANEAALNNGGDRSGTNSTYAACLASLDPGEAVLAASPRADFLVTRHTNQGESEVRLRSAKGTKPLIALNEGWSDIDWGRVVPVPHPGPAGEPLTSWLLLPPGAPPGARLPVVVEVYPGTAPRSAPSALLPGGTRMQNNPAVIAGAGYAVLIVSLPLAPGERRPAAGIADRILVAVDAAGDLGLVDPKRVALIGHSFGGYGVLSAVTQSDRFRAVIASNGYPDLSLSLQLPPFFRVAPEEGVPVGQMIGWGETGQASIGDFAAAPEAYVEASPLYQVEAIHTPALLIESDLDNQRMSTLFSALYRRNREAGLLTYFGEGHTYASPGNLRDLHARILDWLARYLGPPSG